MAKSMRSSKFMELNPEIPVLECNLCKHYTKGGTCKAYPDGIPLRILQRDVLHREVQDDQEGDFVYEKR